MEKTILYVDVLLLINGAMDGALLWLTSRLWERPLSVGRLAGGVLLGSLTTWSLLLPPGWEWTQGLAGRVLVALAMIGWTFRPQGWREGLKISALFFFANFSLGSFVLGVQHFLLGRGESRLLWVGLGFGVVLAAGHYVTRWWKRGGREIVLHLPVEIQMGESRVQLQGFCDSGNRLRDPLSQRPVLVAEFSSLAPLLPPGWSCRAEEEWSSLPEPWLGRLRLIPFSSVGNPQGLLVGFRPDRVMVGQEERSLVVAVAHHRISPNGSYQALIPWQGM